LGVLRAVDELGTRDLPACVVQAPTAGCATKPNYPLDCFINDDLPEVLRIATLDEIDAERRRVEDELNYRERRRLESNPAPLKGGRGQIYNHYAERLETLTHAWPAAVNRRFKMTDEDLDPLIARLEANLARRRFETELEYDRPSPAIAHRGLS
jgi:hypothetical protein